MNKIDQVKTGGVKVYLNDLQFLYNSTKAVIEAFVGAFTNGIAKLSGCTRTWHNGVMHITEGFVIFRGEVIYMPETDVSSIGTSGIAYFSIHEAVSAEGTRLLEDSGQSVEILFNRTGIITQVNDIADIPEGYPRWDLTHQPVEFHEIIKDLYNQ